MKTINTLVAASAAFVLPVMAFAEGEAAAAVVHADKPMYAMAKGLAIGAAALGCALGQAKIVSAALEGIGRNPGAAGQIFTPMLLGVAFVETLLIFTLFLSGINA